MDTRAAWREAEAEVLELARALCAVVKRRPGHHAVHEDLREVGGREEHRRIALRRLVAAGYLAESRRGYGAGARQFVWLKDYDGAQELPALEGEHLELAAAGGRPLPRGASQPALFHA
ncbi:hypothetical protein, partial [Kineococcus indalonis]|uniref:hypothetical protein n=1 Tax=Kineococcus indalonis TaxID=2696566 RepID=UPI001413224D